MRTPEERQAAAKKGQATRAANRARAEAYETFHKNRRRKLEKVEAIAADDRCDPNTRAVARATAEKLRTARAPGSPPPLPRTMAELVAMRRKRRQ